MQPCKSLTELRETADYIQKAWMEKCFSATDSEASDLALARKYVEILESLAKRSREEFLAISCDGGGFVRSPDLESGFRDQQWQGEQLRILRSLADASGNGFFVADIQGNLTYVNQTLCRILGEHDQASLVGKNISEFYPVELRQTLMMDIFPAAVHEGRWVGELTLLSMHGGETPTIQNIFVVHSGANAPPFVANHIIDISNQKKAEAALRESEQKYRELVENIDEVMFLLDKNGNISYISPVVKSQSGYSPADLVGTAFLDTVVAEDKPMVQAAIRKCLTGIPGAPLDYRLYTKSHQVRWVRASLRSTFAPNRSIGVQGVLIDVTERKLVEMELRTSEQRYRELYQGSPDGFARMDIDGRILECNQAFEDMLGYTQDALRQMSITDITPEIWQAQEKKIVETMVLVSGCSEPYEKEFRKIDGEVLSIETRLFLVKDAQDVPTGLWGYFRDTSHRRYTERLIRFRYEFEALIQKISSNFVAYSTAQIEEGINSALQDIGNFVDAAGAVLYITTNAARPNPVYYEWHLQRESSVKQTLACLTELPLYYADTLRSGDNVIICRESDVPVESGERTYIERHGFRPVVIVPLQLQGVLYGLLAIYGRVGEKGAWRDDTAPLLRIAADVFAAALQRCETEIALSESVELYQTLVSNIPVGVVIYQNEKVAYLNDRFAAPLGYSVDELVNASSLNLIVPEDRERVVDRMRRRFADERLSADFTFSMVSATGETVKMTSTSELIQYNGAAALLSVVRPVLPIDLTEHKKREQAGGDK